MREWLPDLDQGPGPLYLRLARSIAADLASGRLAPGHRLPGSRALARRCKVGRNTVLAAFSELEAEGWIVSRGSRGTFVSPSVAELLESSRARFVPAVASRRSVPRRTAFNLGPPPSLLGGESLASDRVFSDPALLHMGGGLPDPRLCPANLLGRTIRRLLARDPGLLDYADDREAGRGDERLRRVLADYLSTRRALACRPEHLMITRGAQMALWLSAAALVRPGDRVAVERWGYRPAWQALRAHGAELVPISVDARGLRVDRLEAKLAEAPLRAVYLTPHHQFPTTVALAPERRARLLELARRHRFAILEDDYDNEYHHEGRPLLPLASGDHDGAVVYVGSFAKVLAPGLRLGWIVAPKPLIERCVDLRMVIDRQGDRVIERGVAELLEDGEVQRHIWRTRRVLADRRAALLEALERELGGVVQVRASFAGLALWARVDPAIDLDAWTERARQAGVIVHPGRLYHFRRRPRSRLRIGFGRCTEAELREGVRRLARVL